MQNRKEEPANKNKSEKVVFHFYPILGNAIMAGLIGAAFCALYMCCCSGIGTIGAIIAAPIQLLEIVGGLFYTPIFFARPVISFTADLLPDSVTKFISVATTKVVSFFTTSAFAATAANAAAGWTNYTFFSKDEESTDEVHQYTNKITVAATTASFVAAFIYAPASLLNKVICMVIFINLSSAEKVVELAKNIYQVVATYLKQEAEFKIILENDFIIVQKQDEGTTKYLECKDANFKREECREFYPTEIMIQAIEAEINSAGDNTAYSDTL